MLEKLQTKIKDIEQDDFHHLPLSHRIRRLNQNLVKIPNHICKLILTDFRSIYFRPTFFYPPSIENTSYKWFDTCVKLLFISSNCHIFPPIFQQRKFFKGHPTTPQRSWIKPSSCKISTALWLDFSHKTSARRLSAKAQWLTILIWWDL